MRRTGFSACRSKNTIVDRTSRAYVLENRYLKVTLAPEFGGAFFPSSTSRLATNNYIVGCRRTLRDQGRQFLLRLADDGRRHLLHIPGRARQNLAKGVGFQRGKGKAEEVTVAMSLKDDFAFRATEQELNCHRSDFLCHAESRSCGTRCAPEAKRNASLKDHLPEVLAGGCENEEQHLDLLAKSTRSDNVRH
jgi:hypothetical protein